MLTKTQLQLSWKGGELADGILHFIRLWKDIPGQETIREQETQAL